MRIKISADSTCDQSPELIETYNIGITPLYIEKGGQNCRDGMDITPQEIFDYVRSGKGVCRTAAVNVGCRRACGKGRGPQRDCRAHARNGEKSRGELRHRYAFLSAKGRQMLYLGGARREFIEAKAVH